MKREDIVLTLRKLGIARSCIKESEEWVSAPCPFARWTHARKADRSASFGVSVNEDGTSGFNCLACKEHGNMSMLIDSLEELHGTDYSALRDEVESLEIPTAYPPWESRPRRVRVLPEPIDEKSFDDTFPGAWRSKKARAYFKRRKLYVDSMIKFDLRWDAYRNRILFKVKQDGLLYGMSGRSVLPDAKNKVKVYNHPKSLFLLGEEHVDLEDLERPLVVIEGLMGLPELDSCSLSDYADAVALQGSDMSEEQAARLVSFGKPVVLLFDNDQAGYDGLHGKKLSGKRRKPGALEQLRGLIEVTVAEWPNGVSDFPELTESELHSMVMKTGPFFY